MKRTPPDDRDETRYDALKLDCQLCFPLYAAAREVVKLYHPFLSELGLTYTQYIALMVFWEERRISVRELGKRLFLDSGTLTPLLKSLEARGYVTRERCREDERVLIVSATDAGMALRDRAASIPQKVAGCVGLEAEDAAALYRILHRLLDRFAEK